MPFLKQCCFAWLHSFKSNRVKVVCVLTLLLPEKTSELGKGHDVFHSTDESKEQGDFEE